MCIFVVSQVFFTVVYLISFKYSNDLSMILYQQKVNYVRFCEEYHNFVYSKKSDMLNLILQYIEHLYVYYSLPHLSQLYKYLVI